MMKTTKDGKTKIYSLMNEYGFKCSLIGYECLADAIDICINDANAIRNITKVLYPTVAERNDTTPTRAERAIRHAIERAYKDNDDFHSLFKDKPTNSETIAKLKQVIVYGI